jgi:hypothetical protein
MLNQIGILIWAMGCIPETEKNQDTSDEVNSSYPDTGDSGQDSGQDSDQDSGQDSGDTQSPETEMVDIDCIDGQYSEVLPTPEADISSRVNSYSPSNVLGFIQDVLGVRYPIGQDLFINGYNNQGGFPDNCLDYFLNDSSSASAVISQVSTLVHECGHFYDMATGGWGENAYHITDNLVYTCSGGSIPSNGGGETFSRSLINNDEYSALHPPCSSWGDSGCDTYALIYLNGNPNDNNFESGDQGFGMLHEETVQYVNSLATSYAFVNEYEYRISARDGILTFLWYTMRYLRMARLQYPDTYALISEDSCWRELILTTWGRAWLFLEATEGNSTLGLEDAFLETLVRDADLLEEIQRLRDIEGCE